jgi:glutathione synthase/RimK-type ligase-like ATP-grasp enzyme
MTGAPPFSGLAELDAFLARDPGRTEARYLRATALAALGRQEEAKQDYLAVIAEDPRHFGALNDLGTLLHHTDYRTAARLAYAEAVKHHPDNVIGRINLANALLADGQAEEARAHFEMALTLDPDHPDAHQGMANLLQERNDWDGAERHRQQSYRARTITTLPYRGEGAPCRVLMLVSAVGGNVPARFVLDDALFAVSILVVEAFKADTALPPHDVVFNAIGDADLCAAALNVAEKVLAATAARVINPPPRVRDSGRADTARLLANLPGVVAPRTALVEKSAVAAAAEPFGFPLLVRSPGFHTGQHFRKVEHSGDLEAAILALPGRYLLLIEYLNAFDAEGWARKYRVMMIGGQLFPLHLAISRDWKVHYFTASMAEQAGHRAEEEAFLNDMPVVLGPIATAALTRICKRLGLDYAGIDFGLSSEGKLLAFEANATMVINPPGPDEIWNYRRAAVDRALAAARAMVMRPAPAPVKWSEGDEA